MQMFLHKISRVSKEHVHIKEKAMKFKRIRNTFKHHLIHSPLHRSSNKFYEFKRSEKELATDTILRFLVKEYSV